MKRTYLFSAAALIGLGIFFDWQLSGAADHDQPVSAIEDVETSEIARLSARIDALEKRLAALEQPQHFVRQADSKASENDSPTRWQTPPRPVQDPNDHGAPVQKTNQQTWSFRLLSQKVSESSN